MRLCVSTTDAREATDRHVDTDKGLTLTMFLVRMYIHTYIHMVVTMNSCKELFAIRQIHIYRCIYLMALFIDLLCIFYYIKRKVTFCGFQVYLVLLVCTNLCHSCSLHVLYRDIVQSSFSQIWPPKIIVNFHGTDK